MTKSMLKKQHLLAAIKVAEAYAGSANADFAEIHNVLERCYDMMIKIDENIQKEAE